MIGKTEDGRSVAVSHTRGVLVMIAALALTVRLAVFLLVAPWNETALHDRILIGDAPGYHQLAVNLVRGNGFSMAPAPPFTPDSLRTPGYPVLLAAVYGIAGERPAAALFAQNVLSALTCLLVTYLAFTLWGRRAAIVGGLIVALDPASVVAANQLLGETLFTLILLASLSIFAHRPSIRPLRRRGLLGMNGTKLGKSESKPLDTRPEAGGYSGRTESLAERHWSTRRVWLSGLFMGGAVLIRPIAGYLAGLMCLPVAMMSPAGHRSRAVTAYLLACGLMIAPWLVRNALVFGTPALASFQGENLFVYNAGMLRARIAGRPFDVAEAFHDADGFPGDPFTRSRALSRAALRTMASHPVAYAKLHALGAAATLFAPGSQQLFTLLGNRHEPVPAVNAAGDSFGQLLSRLNAGKNRTQLVYIVAATCVLIAIYALAALGLWGLARQQALPLVLAAAFFALAPGPQGEARFRVPMMPLIALAAAAGFRRDAA